MNEYQSFLGHYIDETKSDVGSAFYKTKGKVSLTNVTNPLIKSWKYADFFLKFIIENVIVFPKEWKLKIIIK